MPSECTLHQEIWYIANTVHFRQTSRESSPLAQIIWVPSKYQESLLTIAKVGSLGAKLGRQEWQLGYKVKQ